MSDEIKEPELQPIITTKKRGRPKGSTNKSKMLDQTVLAPATVFDKRDPEKGPKIEVTRTGYDPVAKLPGIIPSHGLILDHTAYITPDPSMDYRFCTNDGRRTGRNRVKGWQNVTVGGHTVVVGNMTLCQRPKSIGEQVRTDLENRVMATKRKHSAESVARANPGVSGSERTTVQEFKDNF